MSEYQNAGSYSLGVVGTDSLGSGSVAQSTMSYNADAIDTDTFSQSASGISIDG